jgi:queuine/archaeosine tRNA-ribosyltransferase
MTTPGLPTVLNTPHGPIRLPVYVPVTTFGGRYPLDDLVRPYLPRLAPAAMVSFYYAKQMKERPALPLLIDSGGFASLFQNARVIEVGGLGVLETNTGEEVETLRPSDVLDFQERFADLAFTLDFPIPPSMDVDEAKRRQHLTVANALWAIANRRRKDMLLYGCVQGWDVSSYRQCALAYASLGFDGLAIGGLVPRISDLELVLAVVDTVRDVAPGLPLHVFGLGNPGTAEVLYAHGVSSVDSSSYVKLAADGKLWGQPSVHLSDASPAERLNLALCNLAMATQRTLPLSTSHLLFGSRGWHNTATLHCDIGRTNGPHGQARSQELDHEQKSSEAA